MKLLITGATGFVGRNLLPILLNNKKIENILLFVNNKEKALKMYSDKKISFTTLSDDYKNKIKEFNPDKVIHLAAYLTSKNDINEIDKLLDANIRFGTFLLDSLKDCNISEFLNFGTFAEYRFGVEINNAYLYSATKSAFKSILDYYSELINFKYYNIIPYSIYGGIDSQKKVIDYIKDSFNKEIDMTLGEQILDFIHIDDVCNFIETLLFHEKEIPNKTNFHLGTGHGTSIRELSEILEKKYNKKCHINWGKLPYRERDIMYAVAPIGNNLKYLNWRAKINLKKKKIIILGAGISGIGAGYFLSKNKENKVILFEKNNSWGGLCDNFEINGFRFDKFVHLSFTRNKEVRELFDKSIESLEHTPNPANYYKGYWLKHPAQNDLFPLEKEEKEKILHDFLNRKEKTIDEIKNYEEWLRIQYGDYFAKNFPMRYTKKYWGVEAKELETKWVENRMYKPSIEEVKEGMQTTDTPVTYYAKKMYYPVKGGYKSYLNFLVKDLDIRLENEVLKIDPLNKIIYLKNGNKENYDKLISSIPLPKMVNIVENTPKEIIEKSKLLKWTSGYIVSIGLKTKEILPYLWFYIYDEDIPFARVYSPSHKSEDNCPEGCSSLQLEIYFEHNNIPQQSKEKILEKCIVKLEEMNVIRKENIVVKDIRFEKYANIIFDFNIYEIKKEIREYLKNLGIETIGRFGEWDYFWSDQSLLSGKNIVKEF